MMVTPANAKELAQAQKFDQEANEAEIILSAERARGLPFKNLDKDSYGRKRIVAIGEQVDMVDEAHGWRKGQSVKIVLNNPLAEEVVTGKIQAVSTDGAYIRVAGRHYQTNLVKRTFV